MKTGIIKASLPLVALSLACSPTEVGAAGIRGSILPNGSMNELTSELNQAENIHRRLEEGGEQKDNAEEGGEEGVEEEEVAEEEEEVEEEEEEEEEEEAVEYDYDYGYEYGSFETEDMQYADEEDEDTTTMSRVEQYEAQAVQLFETAPSEWNPGQWDLLFALFGSVLVSCCVMSAFFAYCCIFREDDDGYAKGERSVRKRRRHKRKDDDDTVGSEYAKEVSLLPENSRTFSPLRSWVSGSTYFSDNDESAADESNEKEYSAPSADVTSPTATVTSGGFAEVDQGAAILHQNTGVTQKSTVPHQSSGITMKSEVVEM